jgi:hypothetical protein
VNSVLVPQVLLRLFVTLGLELPQADACGGHISIDRISADNFGRQYKR